MSVVITCSTRGLDPRVASTPDTILAFHGQIGVGIENLWLVVYAIFDIY